MRRNLLDDIVETSKDLSKTRVGKAERGGSVELGAVLTCACACARACACACNVELKRSVIEVFTLLGGRVHRARAVRGFPGSMVAISLE